MATRSKKPKCDGKTSQSCGMSCISREDTCREQITADVAARLVQVATQNKQANDASGSSFDAVMSQFPPKLLKEAHKTGVATSDLGNGAVLTTKEAVGLDGSKIKYGFVTDADGKRYTVSDGLVKEVTSAAGTEWQESFEAAVRSKIAIEDPLAKLVLNTITNVAPQETLKVASELLSKEEVIKVYKSMEAAMEGSSGRADAMAKYYKAVEIAKSQLVDKSDMTKEWSEYEKGSIASDLVSGLKKAMPRAYLSKAIQYTSSNLNQSDLGHKVWPEIINTAKSAANITKPLREQSASVKAKLAIVAEVLGTTSEIALVAVRSAYGHTTNQVVMDKTAMQMVQGSGDQAEALQVLFDKAPKYKGEIFRGIRNVSASDLKGILENGIHQGGTTSWSSSELFAVQWQNSSPLPGTENILFKVANKTGVSIKAFASIDYKAQDEVLGKPNTKFKVLNSSEAVYDKQKYRVIELQEL